MADPQRLDRLLDGWDPARRILWADESAAGTPLSTPAAPDLKAADPWAILTGPEGGFSPAERDRLRGLPFVTPISLGPRILRAETAALATMVIWQTTLGDWR